MLIFNHPYKREAPQHPTSVQEKPPKKPLSLSNRLFLESLGYHVSTNIRYPPKTKF